MRGLSCLVVMLAGVVLAEEPTDAKGYLIRGLQKSKEGKLSEAAADLTKGIEKDPKNADLYSARGGVYFMLGKIKESVADFDKQIELNPTDANGHWRRGISLYYVGEHDKGRKQFEGYEKVDTNDVENAVWHFMCVAKKDGLEKARKSILKIGKDRRPILMEVYEMFKGTLKPADVLAAAEKGDLSDAQRNGARFYAHLYVGIYHDLSGDKKKAAEALDLAANKYKIGHYMGDVARVHLDLLKKEK